MCQRKPFLALPCSTHANSGWSHLFPVVGLFPHVQNGVAVTISPIPISYFQGLSDQMRLENSLETWKNCTFINHIDLFITNLVILTKAEILTYIPGRDRVDDQKGVKTKTSEDQREMQSYMKFASPLRTENSATPTWVRAWEVGGQAIRRPAFNI